MKRFAATLSAVVAMACAGAAHAATDYNASFQFQSGLPALRTGTGLDGPHNLAGDWTSMSDPRARGTARDRTADGSGWQDWQGTRDMHRVGGVPTSMGEAIGNKFLLDGNAHAQGAVSMFGLSASGGMTTFGRSEIDAAASWGRDFSLEAGTSFTFTGLATLGVTGDDAPLDIASLFAIDQAASFASLVLGDIGNRVRCEMTAAITSVFVGDWNQVFSHSVTPGGLLSLTVTNITGERMTGRLGAGSYVSVSAPVPEPATVVLMVAGVALVGAAARRRA